MQRAELRVGRGKKQRKGMNGVEISLALIRCGLELGYLTYREILSNYFVDQRVTYAAGHQ